MSIIQERVCAGILYLNNRLPGWKEYVSLNRLDMADENYCILGQVSYGIPSFFPLHPYVETRDFLGLAGVDAIHYGFAVSCDENAEPLYSYDELTEVWKGML